MSFPRELALAVAEEIKAMLNPFVEKIEIAGSLRRGQSQVGDVELLFVPKFIHEADGLFDKTLVSLADREINRMLNLNVIEKRPSKIGTFTWGPNNKLSIHKASGVPVDLFTTTMEKWFVSLVIRTGSKETNLRLTMGAQKLNRTLHAYGSGVEDRQTGEIFPCRSEREVFDLCRVPYTDPKYR